MKETFFRSMSWLHTWAGLLVCWLLLLVFFAGTLSFFRHEISLYSKPELHQNVLSSELQQSLAHSLQQGQAFLQARAPKAPDWYIELPTERRPYLAFSWSEARKPGEQGRPRIHSQVMDMDGNPAPESRDTLGGNFFYRLHFDLHYLPVPLARYLVGICTMFMLIALISGIIIHKRIFKDFFSFRPGKGSRSWLDAHNLSSVMALPFHLVITYTGLITLMLMYMPWAAYSVWDGDARAMRQELSPRAEPIKASGMALEPIPISQLLPQVQAIWGNELALKEVRLQHPGDTNGRISFTRDSGREVTDERDQLVFSASGELLSQPKAQSTVDTVHDTLMALHTARFAGPLLRVVGFVMGLLGCVMIASGCLMWALRLREKRKQGFGLSLVEGLNLTAIVGLPLGTLLFFYANRILPTELPGRAQWEVHAFFIGLGICALVALFRRDAAAWRSLLAVTGLLALLMPLLNSLTAPLGLIGNMAAGQWPLVVADLLFLLTALACLQAVRKLPKGIPASAKALREQTA